MHGYEMGAAIEHQKLATDTGYWPLYRFDPRRAERGEPALIVDSALPKSDVGLLMTSESRFKDGAFVGHARQRIARRAALYAELAKAH